MKAWNCVPLAAVAGLLTLAGCGGNQGQVVTRTVTAPSWAGSTKPAAKPATPQSDFTACDANISAKKPNTSCGFASNVFYEYWSAGSGTGLRVYSPVSKRFYDTTCSGTPIVVCTAGDGAEVRFPQSAIDAYNSSAAAGYAASHDTGRGTTSSGGGQVDGNPDCGKQNGVQVITSGDVTCDEATFVAAKIDVSGDKVQVIDGWTCEFGNASVRPTVYTCSKGGRSFEGRES